MNRDTLRNFWIHHNLLILFRYYLQNHNATNLNINLCILFVFHVDLECGFSFYRKDVVFVLYEKEFLRISLKNHKNSLMFFRISTGNKGFWVGKSGEEINLM